ncbi:MAG: flagellar biosynthesis protein FlhB [Gammaproteobacteria bacterium]|nr:flagellar biosynthesis protein FlhB [Gammaproteobacteria bacterium]
MADDSQERSEEPTGKRLSDARAKGQVARSKELGSVLVLLTAGAMFIIIGEHMMQGMMDIMSESFVLHPDVIHDAANFPFIFMGLMEKTLRLVAPFLFAMIVAGVSSNIALSGWNFSTQAMAPKLSKLDPIKGMGKLFAWRGLVELAKALAKFILVVTAAVLYLQGLEGEFIGLGYEDLESGMAHMGSLLTWVFIILSATLILVAAVDVPFQLWDHKKQMKMAKQEVKEENKQTEGSPEVKGRQRQIQFQMTQKRMMEAVPQADVVITNPTHYAVALRYEGSSMSAPILVAKGGELIAQKIREVAKEHQIPIVSSPPLCRAIFYSTELDRVIPEGLYRAVAQVLAYVYHLRQGHREEAANIAKGMDSMEIPEEYQHD